MITSLKRTSVARTELLGSRRLTARRRCLVSAVVAASLITAGATPALAATAPSSSSTSATASSNIVVPARDVTTPEGHHVVIQSFTSDQVKNLRVGQSLKIGTLDEQPLRASRTANGLDVNVGSRVLGSATGKAGGLKTESFCSYTLATIVFGLGAVGITALIIAAGPEAEIISIAGYRVAIATARELRILAGSFSTLNAYIGTHVC